MLAGGPCCWRTTLDWARPWPRGPSLPGRWASSSRESSTPDLLPADLTGSPSSTTSVAASSEFRLRAALHQPHSSPTRSAAPRPGRRQRCSEAMQNAGERSRVGTFALPTRSTSWRLEPDRVRGVPAPGRPGGSLLRVGFPATRAAAGRVRRARRRLQRRRRGGRPRQVTGIAGSSGCEAVRDGHGRRGGTSAPPAWTCRRDPQPHPTC